MHKSYVLTSSNNWLLIVDIEVLLISFFVSYRFASRFSDLLKIHEYMWILIVIIPMWVILMSRSRMYTNITFYTFERILGNIFLYSVISNVFVAAMLYFVKDYMFSRFLYIVFSMSSFCFVVLEWYLCKLYISKKSSDTKNMPRVIIIGVPRIALKFKHFMRDAKIMVNFLGYVQLESTKPLKRQIKLGDVKDLESIIVKNIVDEVVFAIPRDYVGEVEQYVLLCERMGITVRMILDLYDLKIARTHLSKMGSMPMLTYHTVSLSDLQLFTKRVMDVAGALFGMILAAIPSLIIAIAIKRESPGPVIFAQDRVGLNGRVFKFYKFRSMYIDAEKRKKELMARNQVEDGMMFKIKDDPRITKVGSFIRKTSLDELPQFINVLKGDMSLIGTRPPTIDEVVKYKDYHRRRISIKPGITGLWQISGRSNIINFDEVVGLDTKYIDKWSIWLDIKVIIKTILSLVSRKGAY